MDNSKPLEHQYMQWKRCRHGMFLFNRHDQMVGRALNLYGEWCEAEIHVLEQLIEVGSMVVDVGANIGTHTVPFARQVGESGRVIAFEPQRLIFQNLCANIAINELRNVSAYQVAVAEKRAQLAIPVIDPRQLCNFAAVSAREHPRGEPTDVIRIDDLNLKACRLIKIDVEGAEPDVLEGGRETIDRLRPVLFVENNTVEGSAKVIDQVFSLGYQAFWHLANYFNPDNFFRNKENVFAGFRPEANLLCFHQSHSVDISGCPEVTGVEDNWLEAARRLS